MVDINELNAWLSLAGGIICLVIAILSGMRAITGCREPQFWVCIILMSLSGFNAAVLLSIFFTFFGGETAFIAPIVFLIMLPLILRQYVNLRSSNSSEE